jgi:peptidoglycan/xylan/chitin deacetylase (PgdA/CDA1 family)
LNFKLFNISYIILILLWIWADRYLRIGAAAYGWLFLIYCIVLFCGTYFIQWGFFLKSVCSAPVRDKKIAITFDDGPTGENTDRVLNLLKEHQMQAAFFCIGKKINDREAQLKRIVEDGHIIGNHSYSHHPLFGLFSPSGMLTDLKKMSAACKAITGLTPAFFRPPYGVTNPNLRSAIIRCGVISVGWSIRSYDTVIHNENRLLTKILSSLKPGAILLLHDTQETTVRILPRLLKGIEERGYQVIRLDKLINLSPYE